MHPMRYSFQVSPIFLFFTKLSLPPIKQFKSPKYCIQQNAIAKYNSTPEYVRGKKSKS